jgi:phthalate 4,5-cis-dihydrodiol dehydrogenase
MIKAARDARIHLLIGHSHSFNAPILRARSLIDSGEYGEPRLVTALNYTDFVYRPRRPEEFDTAQGGGVVFSQGAHQVDIVRMLAGRRVTSIRSVVSAWDPSRPMDGAYNAFLAFENGVAASLIYSGYGNFDADEFQNWIGEMGDKKEPGVRRRVTFDNSADEASLKQSRSYGGADFREANAEPYAHQNFGTVIVSCERADLRPLPTGVMVYCKGESRLDPLPAPKVPRAEVIDELYDAVVNGIPPKHSGEWAMATLEVCLAMLQSGRENREVEVGTA